ncbi:MAG TPA: ClpXP protease specificity-enhancing factor SspB [Polyangiaceae bacterium]|nr:ClpXP protease specificity-enhancing factor SspB [Polyangiaceae bacterium]
MSPPPKKNVALALIEQGTIYVHLDPRKSGVVVPKEFQVQQELVLSFGYAMRVPVPDLDIDDEGISGTLSFNRRPFWCKIPWSAVYAIIDADKRGAAWPEDAPSGSRLATASNPPPPKRSHLRAVGPEDEAPSDDASLEGEGICGICATRWVEDASSCPVCGASRAEAFKKLASDSAEAPPAAPRAPSAPPALAIAPKTEDDGIIDDEPPPPPPPKGRPQLRLVKK